MFKAIQQLTKYLPQKAFKSFISDRGKEFACYSEVEEKGGIDFYFADPYSAWQRGTNKIGMVWFENFIRRKLIYH